MKSISITRLKRDNIEIMQALPSELEMKSISITRLKLAMAVSAVNEAST